MDLKCSKKDRIILRDNCGQTFEGIVKNVNENLGRLLLSDVVLREPQKRCLNGLRHFDRNDIVELEVICTNEFESNSSERVGKGNIIDEGCKSTKIETPFFKLIKKLQSEYCFIKDFGTNFHVAVCFLKKSSIIGLYAENVSKGRAKRASLIALSTNSHVFVFDLFILGDNAFDRGLREILESYEISKVVYDCRFLSDCLKHKHKVNLVNVRDVEAEDIIVVYQQRKIIRNHSRSLNYLAEIYLNFTVENCNISSEAWDKRPLLPNLVQFLVSSVAVLIPLHEIIQKTYVERLICASEIYNNHVRNSDIFELVQTDAKYTLKKQMIELVSPNVKPRVENFVQP